MDKEELIKRLTKIKERIDDTSEKEKLSELDKLEQAREELMFEEAKIKQKLSDDNNYIIHNFFVDKSKKYDLENSITKLEKEKLAIQASLKEHQSTILENEKDVSSANELLSETQQMLENISKEYRSLKNATKEQDDEYRAKMNDCRDMIKWLENEIKSTNEDKEYNTNQVNNFNARNKEIDSRIKRFQKLLANLEEKDKETVNNVQKQKDRERLLQISQMYEVIDNREKVISYNYQKEIDNLIEDINNDKEIDLLKLAEIKANLPVKDYENYEEKKESLASSEAELLQIKLSLEEKLSDENNYIPSIFAAEVMDEEIKDLEISMVNHEADIANIDLSVARSESNVSHLENSISTYENEITRLEEENNDIRLKLAVMPDLTYKQVNNLTKTVDKNNRKIKNDKEEIDKIRKSIEAANLNIVLLKRQKKTLNSIYTKIETNYKDKKETLADRKAIDRQKMEEDRTKLSNITIQLDSIHHQQELLDYDYEQEFNDIYKMLLVSPVITKIEKEPVLEDKEPLNEKVLEENESTLKESEPINEETIVEPVIETKSEELPIIVPKFKQAKEKIYYKIHNPEFIKKAKEFFSRVAVFGVTIAIAVSLLKGCQVLNKKDYDDAPNIPLEDLDDKEIDIVADEKEPAIEVIKPQEESKQEKEPTIQQENKQPSKQEIKEEEKDQIIIPELSDIPLVNDIPAIENKEHDVPENPIIDDSTNEKPAKKDPVIKEPVIETPSEESTIERPSLDSTEDITEKIEVTTLTPEETISYSPVYDDGGEIKKVIISDNSGRAIIDDPTPVDEPMQREKERFQEYLENKGVEVEDAYSSPEVTSISYDGSDMQTTYETSNEEPVTNLNEEIRNMYEEIGLGGDYEEKQADNDALLEELGKVR